MQKKTIQSPHRRSAEKAETKAQIKPFGDRVLVRPFTEDEVKGSKGNHYGIIIPDTVSKEKSAQGKVLEVGPGRYEDGKLVPLQIKVGNTIIFSKYGYDEVELGGEELYLIKEEHILAIIK